VVYATAGSKVYKSENKEAKWDNFSGKPLYSAVFNTEQVVHINLSSKPQGTYIISIEPRQGMIIKMLELGK